MIYLGGRSKGGMIYLGGRSEGGRSGQWSPSGAGLYIYI
jgi:hypothetical protein